MSRHTSSGDKVWTSGQRSRPLPVISFIGAGNVAACLALLFKKSGYRINEIFSLDFNHARRLAHQTGAKPCRTLTAFSDDSDVYIISVKDSSIREVASRLHLAGKTVAHTSGSVSKDVLKTVSCDYGVLYPVQSIKKARIRQLGKFPVCIEYSSKKSEKILLQLANSIAGEVHRVNFRQRQFIHLSAVFANNFTNYLYMAAEQILKKSGIPFDILYPLITETAARISKFNPHDVQTGPAVRNEKNIIRLHRKLLKRYPEYKKLYDLITKGIQKEFY